MYKFDTVLYQFLESGTSNRCLICIVKPLRFSGFSRYSHSFCLYSPFNREDIPKPQWFHLFLSSNFHNHSFFLSSFIPSCFLPTFFCHKLKFIILLSLQLDGINLLYFKLRLLYFKLRLFNLIEFIVWIIRGLQHQDAMIQGLENHSLWQTLNFFHIQEFSPRGH